MWLIRKGIKFQFIFIISVSIILFIGFLLIVTHSITQLINEKYSIQYKNTNADFAAQINNAYKDINGVFQNLKYDKDIINYFLSPRDDKYLDHIRMLNLKTSYITSANSKVVEIAFLDDQNTDSMLFNSSLLKELRTSIDTYDPTYLGTYVYSQGKESDTRNQLVLLFGINVYDYTGTHNDSSKILGSIIVGEQVNNFISAASGTSPEFYIYNQQGIFPLNSIQKNLPPTELSEIVRLIDQKKDFPMQYETDKHYLYIDYVQEIKTNLITSIPKYLIRRELNQALIYMVIVMLLFFIMMAVTYRVVLRGIIKPINQLYRYITKGKTSGMYFLESDGLSITGNKEVTILVRKFNFMLQEINLLTQNLMDTMSTLYETEVEKNKAEISFLRSQINPHFLYNTLQTIKGLAIEHEVPQIATIATSMGKMYRYSTKGEPTVALSQELEIVKAYLDIQRVRFSENFDVIYNFDDTILKTKLIKMLLQPLVENAVFHGLESKTEQRILYLSGKREQDLLILIIQDDGIGIEAEIIGQLTKILSGTTTEDSDVFAKEHTGIMNVNNRIKLVYGSSYGLHYESEYNYGTKVIITLPYITED